MTPALQLGKVSFEDFIYLFERERESMRGERSAGEADSLLSEEPDVGLDPRTPGS